MKKLFLIAAIATLPIISFAQDGIRGLPKAGAFSVTPEFGVDVIDNSKYSSAYSETLAGAGTYLGRAATAAVTFSSTAQNFDQVFDRALNYGASFNYGLTDSTELFGRFKYTHADANIIMPLHMYPKCDAMLSYPTTYTGNHAIRILTPSCILIP